MFRSVPTRRGIENAKKQAKKLKNTIMTSFQAKIVWKRPWKSETKNYRFVSFRSYLTRYRKFQKNSKIIQKIKKIQLWLHFKPKSVERGWEREKIKIIVSFRPYLTQNLKFQKNSNNTSVASFKARIGWKRPRKKENKYCRSASFLPNA